MTDHDMSSLGDELHELAGTISPSSAGGRDRARRAIARHQRNRRAAITATAAVALVAASVFVAVGRERNDSAAPVGTTSEPTTSSSPTTVADTSTTGAPTPTDPHAPIAITIPTGSPPATSVYRTAFPWGTASNEVAFRTPAGEGASGGPVAFTADAAGNIVLLDQSSSRLVRRASGTGSTAALALASPAVTAAAFDSQGRVIVASLADVAVFGPTGHAEGSWTALPVPGGRIDRLEVDGNAVYAVDYSFTKQRTRTALLRDDGSGYVKVAGAATEPDPIVVDEVADLNVGVIHITAGGRDYRITTGLKDLRSVRLLPDHALVFVVGNVQSDSGHTGPVDYTLVRIDADGHAHYGTITASVGYLNGGPVFDITADGVAVMGSTIAGGVTVAYYRF
jgi:hypothetical protein